MLIQEWAFLILVAISAERLGIGTKLMFLRASMRIMATRAIHHAFFEAVVRRFVKVRTCSIVAGQAQF